MRRILLWILFSYSFCAPAQTFQHWSELVGWDGASDWKNYLIFSPKFMGPNALTVPAIGNGSADSINSLSIYSVSHFSRGDNTYNLKLTGNYCVVKNRISVDVTWVPIEWFNVTPQVKDKRHVYFLYYDDKKAQGDIYANVNIQLLNRWRKDIHLAWRAGYRYPTSTGVGAARYTDAPGYHFDISFAKPCSKDRLKFVGMIGFYVWQLNNNGGQNDALLYAGGLEYNYNNWRLTTGCRGYSGYRHNGDDPIVIGSSIEKRLKNISILVNLQQGLQDYDFTSVETGVKYNFK